MRRLPAILLVMSAMMAALGCGQQDPNAPRAETLNRLDDELTRWGGGWEAWCRLVKPYHDDVRTSLAGRPNAIGGIPGLGKALFFRKSLEVLVSGDLRQQADGRDPYPAVIDFAEQLRSRGVDLLFCPIPVKGAVMPDTFSERAPSSNGPYPNPWTRKLLRELTAAGVECVDLLPHLIEGRARTPDEDPVYMLSDTHWSPRGLEIAAKVIAERVRAYDWYDELEVEPVEYTLKPVTAKRRGDIVHMIPEREKRRYPPTKFKAHQVIAPDGSPYEDTKSSPILFLGDSYSGVFHFEDCQHAGVTAHIARELKMPVDLILGQGMGPKVREKLARRGRGALRGKHLVIWALSERDLWNYREPWKVVPVP